MSKIVKKASTNNDYQLPKLPVSPRTCSYCGKPLRPKEYRGGAIESSKQFSHRRFCDRHCSNLYHLEHTNHYWFSEDGLTGYGSLPTGEIFIFDGEDFELIKNKLWCRNKCTCGVYVVSTRGERLHRLIVSAPKGFEVDHIDMNSLDNRKKNLRICSHRQNQCNQSVQSNNTSGVAGVAFNKARRKFSSRIKFFGRELSLGYYASFTEAVQARNEGMKWLFGDFARYENVPNAPQWIKDSVKEKCSRLLNEMAVSFCRENGS
jgi:hypothetical protein